MSENGAISDAEIRNTAKGSGTTEGPSIKGTTNDHSSHSLSDVEADDGTLRKRAEGSGTAGKSLASSITNDREETDDGSLSRTAGGLSTVDVPPSHGSPGMPKESLVLALMERTGANATQLVDYMLQSSHAFLGRNHGYDVVGILLRELDVVGALQIFVR